MELAPQACAEIDDASCEEGQCECDANMVASDDGTQCVCASGETFVDPADTSLGCKPGELKDVY